MCRSPGRSPCFDQNTQTIAAYLRTLGSISGDYERREAGCRAAFVRMAGNQRRRSHPGGRRFEFVLAPGKPSPSGRWDEGPDDGAEAVLAEAEAIAERYGMDWVRNHAVLVRAELEGREPPGQSPPRERVRPLRALTARGGRRALAALIGDQGDAELERRFLEPKRQRGLMRAMARSFQPDRAAGFSGIVAYELEPFEIEAPPEAPWRWAIEVDAAAGRARLLEPAPLDSAVTIHMGLAEWVRIMAGVDNAITAMAAGRCSIEGDVMVAPRLEAMFGGGA